MISTFAKALVLPEKYVQTKKKIWMVDVQKPANYSELSMEEQSEVNEQLSLMIQGKYTFLHYNANNLGTKINELIPKTGKRKNPFDNSVVIIDEAHNFISTIKNNLKISTETTSRVYEFLKDAIGCRIILLSGTPIVNHPQEMGILYNVLRGHIRKWVLTITQQNKDKIDSLYIERCLDQCKLYQYDYIDYSRGELTITRNPFGFANKTTKPTKPTLKGGYQYASTKTSFQRKTKRSKTVPKLNKKSRKQNNIIVENLEEEKIGGDSRNYIGTVVNESDNGLTDEEFIKQVVNCLNRNELQVKSKKMVVHTALPEDMKAFQDTFVRDESSPELSDDISNKNTLFKRILGLTSYFRSPKEGLLPDYVKTSSGEDYHEVRVPMSDMQFEHYAKLRTEERKMEQNAKKKQNAKKNGNHDVLESAGSYRSSSRMCCNYSIPTPPGRPRKMDFMEDEDAMENDNNDELEVGEGEVDTAEKNKQLKEKHKKASELYKKEIEKVTLEMYERKTDFFSTTALELYSPKFLEMLKRVKDENNVGPHLVYSDFLNMEGITFFKYVLEANGMRELKIERYMGGWRLVDYDTAENAGKPAYITYTGAEDDEIKEITRNIYNGIWEKVPDEIRGRLQKVAPGKDNKYGDLVKVIMITKAGAEGINLKCTRYVHVMEPFWHKSRIDQVVGRARRIGSHLGYSEEEKHLRTVQVFLYLSTFSKKQLDESEQYKELMLNDVSKKDDKTPITTDEYLYELSLMKQKLIDQFLHVIKESAIDCRIHKAPKGGPKEATPIVCFGDTKTTTNDFISHPDMTVDIQNEPLKAKKKN